MAAALLFLIFLGEAAAKPVARALHEARSDPSGLEILHLALNVKTAETVLAVFSITLVVMAYSILIQRGAFMSTTAMYPQRSIERNVGSLLSLAWPKSTNGAPAREGTLGSDSKVSPFPSRLLSSAYSKLPCIQLFYLGKMDAEKDTGSVAKGMLDCSAKPERKDSNFERSRLWLTSGSPLTKNVVQILVWEWVSLWLIGAMVFAVLLYNGFLTNQLCTDSYPRLVIILIYTIAYLFHFWYVWNTCMRFFTNVAAGAAWSLLERARFAIGDSKKLVHHKKGDTFNFRGIDKVSSEYVPLSFPAVLKHEIDSPREIGDEAPSPFLHTSAEENPKAGELEEEDDDDPREVRAALATLDAAQKAERTTATESAVTALDRVVANAMVMMGVTIASGFSSWTTRQTSNDSPNNFATTQVGSLALLASLALGTSTMFASAMHLTMVCSSFETILSLKETKINGQALDHYKKRQSFDGILSFSRKTVPISPVGFFEILSTNNLQNCLSVIFLGPVFALMPRRVDHERTSREIDFDFSVRVGTGIGKDVETSPVLFTTRQTDRHARGKNGKNIDPINVCHIGDNNALQQVEKVGSVVVSVKEKGAVDQV